MKQYFDLDKGITNFFVSQASGQMYDDCKYIGTKPK